MADYQFGEVTRRCTTAIWSEFCDWGIELAKVRLADAALPAAEREATWWTLVDALDTLSAPAPPGHAVRDRGDLGRAAASRRRRGAADRRALAGGGGAATPTLEAGGRRGRSRRSCAIRNARPRPVCRRAPGSRRISCRRPTRATLRGARARDRAAGAGPGPSSSRARPPSSPGLPARSRSSCRPATSRRPDRAAAASAAPPGATGPGSRRSSPRRRAISRPRGRGWRTRRSSARRRRRSWRGPDTRGRAGEQVTRLRERLGPEGASRAWRTNARSCRCS